MLKVTVGLACPALAETTCTGTPLWGERSRPVSYLILQNIRLPTIGWLLWEHHPDVAGQKNQKGDQ